MVSQISAIPCCEEYVRLIQTKCTDWACSRYDNAYPSFVHNDPRLGDPKNRKFQFLSCSGAVTDDVLQKQIPDLDQGQQAIMLSIVMNSLYHPFK